MTLAFSQFQTDTRSGAPARRARLFGSLAAHGRRLKCKRPPSGEDSGEAERGSGIGLKLFGFIPESVFTFIPERYSGSSRNAVRMHPGFSVRFRRNPHHPPGTVRDDPTGPSGSRQVPSASASETCPRAAQLHVGLLEAPQAVSGKAVEYFTCFMEIFDFTFPTPAILANRFTQNSRNSSRSRATTRST